METRTLIPVEEYLSTAYSPDCDYVDGEVQERNLGECDHASIQKRFILYFGNREKLWGIQVVPEQRVQVSPTRFRIPDVCVVLGGPDGQILRKPPFLCIEVVSPDDRMRVVDPQFKAAYAITPADGWREVKDGVLRTQNPTFDVPLAEIFA
jgi:Uma2 family endonuclease